MEMCNEINGIISANSKRDINQDKLNEKIRERVSKYFSSPTIDLGGKTLKSLSACHSYDNFIKKLSEVKSSGSVFVLIFSLSDLELGHTNRSTSEDRFELRFGEISINDLDTKGVEHSELLHSKNHSSLVVTRSMKKTSRNMLYPTETYYEIQGKIGGLRLLLQNTTFNRLRKTGLTRWVLDLHQHQGSRLLAEKAGRHQLPFEAVLLHSLRRGLPR